MTATVSIGGMYGKLTTEHSASNYGQPVLVIDNDGRAPEHLCGVGFGPADLLTYDADWGMRGEWSITAAELVRRGHYIDGDLELVTQFVGGHYAPRH